MFSRGKTQLVLIAQNTVSITSGAIALKATCSPTVSIRATIYILVPLYFPALQRRTPDDKITKITFNKLEL